MFIFVFPINSLCFLFLIPWCVQDSEDVGILKRRPPDLIDLLHVEVNRSLFRREEKVEHLQYGSSALDKVKARGPAG